MELPATNLGRRRREEERMLVANAGAVFGVARVLVPVGLVAMVAGQCGDKRRRAKGDATTTDAPTTAMTPDSGEPPRVRRLSKRGLRKQLAAGADPRTLVLQRANLDGVNLAGADLGGVDLTGAHLCGANLSGADLGDAMLRHADLSGANLRDATLAYADLTDCDLTGADLRGADLSLARNASTAWLRRALHTPDTKWPPHFDPAAAGAVARAD
jgi:hypothetical protein